MYNSTYPGSDLDVFGRPKTNFDYGISLGYGCDDSRALKFSVNYDRDAQFNNNKLKIMNKTQEQILPENIKSLIKVGWMNDDLTLNGDGHRALLEMLAEENLDKMTEKANEIIKKREERLNKNNKN